MDSVELANELAERMNNEAPMIGGALDIHTIIHEVLLILKDKGFIDLEPMTGDTNERHRRRKGHPRQRR